MRDIKKQNEGRTRDDRKDNGTHLANASATWGHNSVSYLA